MTKYSLTLFVSLLQFCLLGQNSEATPIIKTCEIYTNKKLTFSYVNDKEGNPIFCASDEMNGDISTLIVTEFDSLNRERRVFFAHSNMGFSLDENVYTPEATYHYSYESGTADSSSFDRPTLNKIKTQSEFLQLPAIQSLSRGKRQLQYVEILDSAQNVVTEIYFSANGDTSSINRTEYNSNNKELVYHYGERNKEPWIWDIYYLYDDHWNKVQSIRLSSVNGKKDTTEIYTNNFNSSNLLESKNYYNKKKFINRTEYTYNTKKELITERFYETEEYKLDVLTSFEYYENGYIKKKTQTDYRQPKRKRKTVSTYKLTYW